MTEWLTVPESAEYSKFSTRTIRQRIHDGDLPAYMPRGSNELRIDRADLDDMIRRGAARRERRLAAQQEAVKEWARNLVSTWPPLTEEERDALRHLLDCSGGGRRHGDG